MHFDNKNDSQTTTGSTNKINPKTCFFLKSGGKFKTQSFVIKNLF